MHNDIQIEQACQASAELLSAMTRLMAQLTSAATPSLPELDEMLTCGATTLLLARQPDGQIIGMGALAAFRVPSGLKAWIEDVVVDETCRGLGIGEALTLALIDHARQAGVLSIHLTSNHRRAAANQLYQKLGFERHETNLYQLKLR